jgi:hypothetical protein
MTVHLTRSDCEGLVEVMMYIHCSGWDWWWWYVVEWQWRGWGC